MRRCLIDGLREASDLGQVVGQPTAEQSFDLQARSLVKMLQREWKVAMKQDWPRWQVEITAPSAPIASGLVAPVKAMPPCRRQGLRTSRARTEAVSRRAQGFGEQFPDR